MSLRLIDNPRKRHELIDDLESLFWSLLYGALHFVKHNKPLMLTGDGDFFNQVSKVIDHPEGEPPELRMEAQAKRFKLLSGAFEEVRWVSDNLTNFMHDLCRTWRVFYVEHYTPLGKGIRDTVRYDRLRADLSNPGWLISEMTRAINRDAAGWRTDMVADQFPAIPAKNVPSLHAAVRTGNFDSSHMAVVSKTNPPKMSGHLPVPDPASQMLVDLATSIAFSMKRAHSDDESDQDDTEDGSGGDGSDGLPRGSAGATCGGSDASRPAKIARTAQAAAGPSSGRPTLGSSTL